jgi:biuret amidohydrolase
MLEFSKNDQTAILVIDMQNDFVKPEGVMPAEGVQDIIKNIANLLLLSRDKGIPVIYTQHVHRKDLSDFGIAHYFEPPSCLEESEGMKIIEELCPQEIDIIVTNKRRYDAFFDTDLNLILRNFKVVNLIVAGVMTDACVFATVHHARCLDYKICIISDCCAGTTAENHYSALKIMDIFCARSATFSEALQLFDLNIMEMK